MHKVKKQGRGKCSNKKTSRVFTLVYKDTITSIKPLAAINFYKAFIARGLFSCRLVQHKALTHTHTPNINSKILYDIGVIFECSLQN